MILVTYLLLTSFLIFDISGPVPTNWLPPRSELIFARDGNSRAGSISYECEINNLVKQMKTYAERHELHNLSPIHRAEIIKTITKEKDRSIGRIVRDAVKLAYFDRKSDVVAA